MLVLNKGSKIILAVIIFMAIFLAGCLVEHFEKDAFIMETVATEDAVSYTSDAEKVIGGKININSADETELVKLEGIGKALSGRIIKYRDENGPYQTIEEIMKVQGISEKKFEDIKEFICVE